MLEYLSDIIKEITAVGWVSYSILGILIVIGIANFTDALRKIYLFFKDIKDYLSGIKYSDQELKEEASETAIGLMNMVKERQNSEPNFDFDNFNESANSQSKHSQETNNLYYEKFAGKIGMLREEFLKRKLKDQELDQFYKHPTNYIGMRIVASKLMELSEKIRA